MSNGVVTIKKQIQEIEKYIKAHPVNNDMDMQDVKHMETISLKLAQMYKAVEELSGKKASSSFTLENSD